MTHDVPDFYCCNDLKWDLDHDGWTVKEMMEILDIKFCPYCNYKLSMLN